MKNQEAAVTRGHFTFSSFSRSAPLILSFSLSFTYTQAHTSLASAYHSKVETPHTHKLSHTIPLDAVKKLLF